MRLNNYIIISTLSHILLFSTLTFIMPTVNTMTLAPVFDVDVIGSLEEKKISSEPIQKPSISQTKDVIKPVPEDVLKETLPQSGTKTSPDPFSPMNMDGDHHTSNPPSGNTPSFLPQPNRHSLLFDKETIEKYAKKEIEQREKGLTFESPELKHRGYLNMLKEKIEHVWKYPQDAAIKGVTGDLYIMFSILKDGRLGEVRLLRTSGFRELDEAALRALKDAEPYWPLPDDWEKGEIPITGHFIYVISGGYIL